MKCVLCGSDKHEKESCPSKGQRLGPTAVKLFVNPTDRLVKLDFGVKVSWVDMAPEDAYALGKALIRVAEELIGKEV